MKILTLNTHSLVEENYQNKLAGFVEFIIKQQPDIIALQEVNQSIEASPVKEELYGFVPCVGNSVPVRRDNHALETAKRLNEAGLSYNWTWLPGKIGYAKYDEGMALFVKDMPILATDSFYISKIKDYENWRTRKILGIQIRNENQWFYTVHMGWWDDPQEPFQYQWEQLSEHLKEKKEKGTVWLMGDFNSPAQVRNQGYDRILEAGWKDTYQLAEEKDSGVTVAGIIDGWRELLDPNETVDGMRIDHIWCSREIPVQSSGVIFDGKNGPVVSDHFGILVEVKED